MTLSPSTTSVLAVKEAREGECRLLDLFSGVGGFSLGLERSSLCRTVAFCEIDPFCRRVLARDWPGVPCYDDVRQLTRERLAADGIAVDAICGGFPCQDISEAGRRAGIDGERSGLWAEYRRLIGELRPRFVFVENVSALARRGLDRVLCDLAALGYDAEWDCVGSDAVGSSQRRERLWLLAYPHDAGLQGPVWGRQSQAPGAWRPPTHSEPLRSALGYWPPRPGAVGDVPRMVDGPADRAHRLRALGNAIDPALPEMIGRAVIDAQQQHRRAA